MIEVSKRVPVPGVDGALAPDFLRIGGPQGREGSHSRNDDDLLPAAGKDAQRLLRGAVLVQPVARIDGIDGIKRLLVFDGYPSDEVKRSFRGQYRIIVRMNRGCQCDFAKP